MKHGKFHGFLRADNALQEVPGLLFCIDNSAHIVFNFLSCSKYRILIRGDQLLQPGVLDTYLVFQAAVIKQIPFEGRPETVGKTVGIKNISQAVIADIICTPAQ